jgi:cyanophycinase
MAKSRSRGSVGAKRPKAAKATPPAPARSAKGALYIIGGREDKQDEKFILSGLARRIGSGKLVIATLASSIADEMWEQYRQIFTQLGVKHIKHLSIEHRDESTDEHCLKILADANAVFFTGGDQVRITTRLGGMQASMRIEEIFREGGIIAGTSAGAAAMSETMLSSGRGEDAYRPDAALFLAPGLGLAKNMIIDQHFSERGRIRRLLRAVAQNPRLLGVGIDEDTAIVVEGEENFEVVGSGSVYIIDGRSLTHTDLSETSSEHTMSVFGVSLHVLSHGDAFDLKLHLPITAKEVQGARNT